MLELRKTGIQPLQFAVRPILPEGLVLFCGRAKSMKSWKMLLICYAVQNGLKFMDHETEQGDCLYLGLEDSKRRLKDRELKLKLNNLTPPYVDIEARSVLGVAARVVHRGLHPGVDLGGAWALASHVDTHVHPGGRDRDCGWLCP